MSDEYKDTRGPAVVIPGSLGTGIRKVYGPFPSIWEAAEWAAPRIIAFGHVTVELLTPPDHAPHCTEGTP